MGILTRVGVVIVVFGVLFGAVHAFAASLDTSNTTLGGGSAVVSSCQSSPLHVGYTTSYDPAVAAEEVSSIVVSGLDGTSATNCAGKSYKVGLVGSGGTALVEVSGTTPATGTSFTSPDLGANHVRVSEVTGVIVTITG